MTVVDAIYIAGVLALSATLVWFSGRAKRKAEEEINNGWGPERLPTGMLKVDAERFADKAEKAAYWLEGTWPFVRRDWAYSRDKHGLTAMRYDDRDDDLWSRIKTSWRWLTEKRSGWQVELQRKPGWLGALQDRLHMSWYVLQLEDHLPDGTLDEGTIITIWEEAGEYIQLVQPSVGDLLAALLRAHPTLPEVRAIVEEIHRIQNDYVERIGEPHGHMNMSDEDDTHVGEEA